MVNTLVGTTGGSNVFPGPDMPFGMVQWSPDSSPDGNDGGGYEYNDTIFRGFGLTHISGPGCGALGDVPVEPLTGGIPVGADPGSFDQRLSHGGEVGTCSTSRSSEQLRSPVELESGLAWNGGAALLILARP